MASGEVPVEHICPLIMEHIHARSAQGLLNRESSTQDTNTHFITNLFSSPCVISNYLGNPSSRNSPTGAMKKSQYNGNCIAWRNNGKFPQSKVSQDTGPKVLISKMQKQMIAQVLCLVFLSFGLIYNLRHTVIFIYTLKSTF